MNFLLLATTASEPPKKGHRAERKGNKQREGEGERKKAFSVPPSPLALSRARLAGKPALCFVGSRQYRCCSRSTWNARQRPGRGRKEDVESERAKRRKRHDGGRAPTTENKTTTTVATRRRPHLSFLLSPPLRAPLQFCPWPPTAATAPCIPIEWLQREVRLRKGGEELPGAPSSDPYLG